MTTKNAVACPKCTHQFTVEDAIYSVAEKEVEAKLRQKMIDWQTKKDAEFKAKEQALEAQQKQMRDEAEKAFEKQRKTMVQELRERIEKENEATISSIRKEAENQSETIKALRIKEVEFLEKEKQLRATQEAMELDKKKWELEKQQELEESIRKAETIKNELKFKEYQKQIDDQKALVEEMRRKAEQGSMQLQGEVQELAIEEWITSKFPFDRLDEIKKGALGGDCVQEVYNTLGKSCGKIYYESKRTKGFQPSWIEKFKADMREIGADIGVLVTQTMPKDMDRFGERDGIWICTYEDFKALSYVLRDALLRVQSVSIAQENKGDKMSLLYDYLISSSFRMSIEAIVESFFAMENDLQREKSAMQRIWKTREKQIEKAKYNTIEMFGNIKGIAGSVVQDIKLLDLDMMALLPEEVE